MRPEVPGDVSAIEPVVAAAYQVYVPRIGRPPAPVADDHAAAARDGNTWVAELDGAVVGLAVLVPRGDHLLLENVAVAPGAQGRGVGGALLGQAEQYARSHGLPEVRLYTNEA